MLTQLSPPPFRTSDFSIDLSKRPRRNRRSAALRSLIQETRLHPSQFIVPLFSIDGLKVKQPILSMPGISRMSVDVLFKEIEEIIKLGIKAVNLFTFVPAERKDRRGTEALRSGNLLQKSISAIKKDFPDLCVMADIALDPFTDHGHDGVVDEEGRILNDETVSLLGQMAVHAAEAGCDVVSPSDMMDGRIAFIRQSLDKAGFSEVGILSYTAKYASAFYGPFREALGSAPKFGDKKTYQLCPANVKEALREAELDEFEGADMLLIKPAMTNLDVIHRIREQTDLPIGAYHVSGEYAMVMAAAKNGWIDSDNAFFESLASIKRAGADFIISYAAKRVAGLLAQGFEF